jgi:hypothetical protein
MLNVDLIEVNEAIESEMRNLKISPLCFESQKIFLPLHNASTGSLSKQDKAKALKFFRLKLVK